MGVDRLSIERSWRGCSSLRGSDLLEVIDSELAKVLISVPGGPMGSRRPARGKKTASAVNVKLNYCTIDIY